MPGRVERLTALVEELTAQRAEERVGELVEVLVESLGDADDERVVGRSAHQGPDVDGVTLLDAQEWSGLAVGDLVAARVVATEGIDLLAEPR
jgi:tRNA A37 methylthiotransferase MiaB